MDPIRYMARKLAEYLRRKRVPGPYPGTAFVRNVLAQHGLLDADLHSLCIVLVDPFAQLQSADNARVVSSKESYRLNRCTDTLKRLEMLHKLDA